MLKTWLRSRAARRARRLYLRADVVPRGVARCDLLDRAAMAEFRSDQLSGRLTREGYRRLRRILKRSIDYRHRHDRSFIGKVLRVFSLAAMTPPIRPLESQGALQGTVPSSEVRT